jgi:Ser/Thr protein kinase RdoA (MazF antagonist)
VIELLEDLVGAPVVLEELKCRPGRRRTLRAVGGRRSAIVKIYASDRVATVAARIRALQHGPTEVRLPEVLLVEPALHLLVLSEVPGASLRKALLVDDWDSCARAGEALGTWHRFWSGYRPDVFVPHTSERELRLLRSRTEQAPPPVAALASSALALSAMAGLGGDWPFATVVHRDLYEEHILVGEHVGVIDLDDAALGPPELDMGNLLAHMELLALRSGRDLTPGAEALLEGYSSSGPSLDPDRLGRCRALTVLRLACIHEETTLLGRTLPAYEALAGER